MMQKPCFASSELVVVDVHPIQYGIVMYDVDV